MTDYNGTISNLIQGVSQQPPMQRFEGQLTSQDNCISSVIDGLKRRPGTELLADINMGLDPFDTHYHVYDRGDGNEKYLIVITAGIPKVYDLETGTEINVDDPAGIYSYTRNGNLKFHTIGDTTFILNKDKQVKKTSYTSPSFLHPYIYLIYLKKANYGTKYTIYTRAGTGSIIGAASYTTDSAVTVSSTSMDKTIGVSTSDVMDELETTLEAWLASEYPAANTFVDTRYGVMLVGSTVLLNITVADTNGNNDILCITDKVDSYEDLPNVCLGGLQVQVVGREESGWDDYYVQFSAEHTSETLSKGRWEECAAYYQYTELDPDTMPYKLIRNAAGTFTCSACDWIPKGAGDDDSNPMPSFVNDYITDIYFYQNRMLLSTRSSVCASMTDDYYNFFSDTVTASSPADPIDTSTSDSKVADIQHMLGFNGSLVIFGKQAQYFHPYDTAFDSDHFSLSAKSNFPFEINVKPQVSDTEIYFPFKLGNYIGVRSLNSNAITGNLNGDDITKHVSQYIHGDVKDIVCDSNNNYLFVNSYGNNYIYVYQWYKRNNELQQQAWHKWKINEIQSIEKLGLIDNILYIIGTPILGSGLIILTIDLSNDLATDYSDYMVLDSMSLVFGMLSGDVYYFSLPYYYYYHVNSGDLKIVYSGSFEEHNAILQEGIDYYITGNEVRVYVNKCTLYHGATPAIYVGTNFESEVELTLPYIKSYNGDSVNKGTLRYKNFLFSLVNSGFLTFKVMKNGTTEYEYEFDAKVINAKSAILNEYTINDYIYQLPVRSRQDRTRIRLFTDSYLPFNITHVEWSGSYNEKGRRI